jgi:hypothetical protein
MFAFAVESTVTNGVSGMVLFASEVSPASLEIKISLKLIFFSLTVCDSNGKRFECQH